MSLLQVGDNVTLNFTTVLDERYLESDIDPPIGDDPPGSDSIWTRMTDLQKAQCEYFLNDVIRPVVDGCELNPTKNYLGIFRRNRVENFINLWPKSTVCHVWFKYPRDAMMDQLINDYGLQTLAYKKNFGFYRITVSSVDEMEKNKEALRDLTRRAFRYFSEGETQQT